MTGTRVPWWKRAARRGGDRRGTDPPAFVELPNGIFTASGTWYHVRPPDLEAYAGDVLARVPLERLLADADTVLRSPQTVALWALLGALVAFAPVQAAAAALVVYVAWSVLAPGFVTLALVRAFRLLESVPLQGLAFIVVLSLLGGAGRAPAVWAGLAGFILLRWGLVDRLAEPVARLLRRSLYRLPLPDQVLRAVIVRHALKTGARLEQLEAMESRMRERAVRRGNKRPTDPH